MNINEFSDNFDVQLNSYLAATPFGYQNNGITIKLDEYEKSVQLTKAHNEIVTGLYTGSLGASFESIEQTRRYLSPYLRNYIKDFDTHELGNRAYSYIVNTPDNCMFIVFESATINDDTCFSGKDITVTPITLDELHAVLENPFRGITDKRVLRVEKNPYTLTLLSKFKLSTYNMVYIKKPSPIILVNLEGTDLSIDGIQTITECEAVPEIHQLILSKAISNVANTRFQSKNEKDNNATQG